VRFHQSRYVHDYILQALQSALSQIPAVEHEALAAEAYSHEPSESEPDARMIESYEFDQSAGQQRQRLSQAASSELGHSGSFPRPSASISASPYGRISASSNQGTNYSGGHSAYGGKDKISDRAIQSYGQLLATPTIVNSGEQALPEQYSSVHKTSQAHTVQLPAMPALLADKFWVFAQGEALKLLELKSVGFHIKKQEINVKLATGLVSQPLLMPVSIKADKQWDDTLVQREALLRQLGLDLTIRYQQLIIKKVPPYLRDSQLAVLIPQLLQWIERQVPEQAALAAWLAKNGQHEQSLTGLWQAFCLLSEPEQQTLLDATPRLPWQDWLKESHSE
jgi:DNA mismatch repair protein MutL